MKIRINGNTLRLRLSKTDLKDLEVNGTVSQSIGFADSELVYSLKQSNGSQIDATFMGNRIDVQVPKETLENWIATNEVGFDATLYFANNNLYILVEKDFKCSIDRGEDESDLFDPM